MDGPSGHVGPLSGSCRSQVMHLFLIPLCADGRNRGTLGKGAPRFSLLCVLVRVCVCACPCVCASVRAHHLFVFLAPFPSTSQGGSPSWPPGCAADLVGPVLPASWLVAGLLPSGPLVRDQLLTVRRFLFSFGRKAVSSGAPGMGSRAGSVTEKGVQMLCAGLTGTHGGSRRGGALASGGGQEALHARRAAPGEGGAPRQGMNVS